jgi:hypothetical protein
MFIIAGFNAPVANDISPERFGMTLAMPSRGDQLECKGANAIRTSTLEALAHGNSMHKVNLM